MQVKICDSLYACDTLEQVEYFVNALPLQLQAQARALTEIMALECMEDELHEFAAYADAVIAAAM